VNKELHFFDEIIYKHLIMSNSKKAEVAENVNKMNTERHGQVYLPPAMRKHKAQVQKRWATRAAVSTNRGNAHI
jgi:hypothetical protein